ncbi:MAG TPA: DCC1-like thiol-disulfide oxidoreductase family protein [Prosthecobacter sp.]|nr:DCC1-like thiol-disulfide oxidoreductase family protein [Prosthecobacter sp.]
MSQNQPTWTNLLLFDGVCGLCIRAVQSILARDPRGVVRFCSIQSELGRRLYLEQGCDPDNPSTMLLLTPKGVFSHSDAMIEVGQLLGGWSRWAVLLKIVPRPLRDWGYKFIARHRYKWFGKRDECMLPQPEWRQRFVG